jgi:hypothetical protein
MALATLPALLLAVLHFRQPPVLQLLLLWAGSLVLQAYGNILLVMLQRGAKQQPAQLHAASRRQVPTSKQQQGRQQLQQHRQQAMSLQPAAPHTAQLPAAISRTLHGWWLPGEKSAETSKGSGSSMNSSSSGRRSSGAVAIVTRRLYRVVQLLGDAFRVWCLCRVGWLLWQQQAPAVAGAWSGVVAGVQAVSSHNAAAAWPSGQLVGAAAAAAVKLQHVVGSCCWLGVDVGLVGACAGVYALAVLGRVLPGLDSML